MEEREKELLEKIDTGTKDVKVPEGLAPDNMGQLLDRQKDHGKTSRKLNYSFIGLVAAACLVLVIGGAALITSQNRNPEGNGTASSDRNRENVPGAEDADTFEKTILATASDYGEVYEYLQRTVSYKEGWDGGTEVAVEESTTSAGAAENGLAQDNTSMKDMSTQEEADFSDTNVREEGIGEADYAKTDGSYLYIRQNNMADISIVDVKNPQMKSVGTIHISDANIREFYIHEEKLLVLCETSPYESEVQPYGDYQTGYNTYTIIATYDISEPKNPEKLGEVRQSGSYYTSRASGGYLYIFSQFYADASCRQEQLSGYIPYVDGDAIAKEKILLPALSSGNQYMVISSILIKEPDKIVDSKAAFSKYGQCYVSGENIYIYEHEYSSDWIEDWNGTEKASSQTTIRKIGYKGGTLTAEAQNTISGYLDSSFSIDEYNGYLRTVVTVDTADKTTSAVYVMNKDLDVIGKIEGLAEDERVYSARFMGDIGYFVTFRETDPLFSVDLSDPENPSIIGKLKIPGFSEYLHVYKDGLLLGIGMDVDEKTQVTGGVKISMFDISDPSNVTEVNKYIIKESYHSEVFYDYKAVLIDAERDIIGFSTEASRRMYYVFGYDDANGFTCKMEKELNGDSYGTARGIYINDSLYVVTGNIVESFSLKNFEKIDDIVL